MEINKKFEKKKKKTFFGSFFFFLDDFLEFSIDNEKSTIIIWNPRWNEIPFVFNSNRAKNPSTEKIKQKEIFDLKKSKSKIKIEI